jgi:hypothetical protein
MEFNVKSLIAAVILTAVSVSANALARPHSSTIRVESPAENQSLDQPGAEAMYLYHDTVGQSLLYVESDHGRRITALDVTDPAKIRKLAQTELPALSRYDFVRSIGDRAVLIRYRRNGELAALSLKREKHPELQNANALAEGKVQQKLGQTALLLAVEQSAPSASEDPHTFEVVDVAHATHPEVLAAIAGVTQQVTNRDTGTLFLLNRKGVTVVRRLRVEEEHQVDLNQLQN